MVFFTVTLWPPMDTRTHVLLLSKPLLRADAPISESWSYHDSIHLIYSSTAIRVCCERELNCFEHHALIVQIGLHNPQIYKIFFYRFPNFFLHFWAGMSCSPLQSKQQKFYLDPFYNAGNESGCNLVSHFPFFIAPHTYTCVYTLVQCIGRATRLRLDSKSFILTCMSVLCPSKMCSALPVFSLQIGSQIKLSSTGSGAHKHIRQAEWLVMTFQTLTTSPFP